MKSSLGLIVSACLMLASSVGARVGETVAQCDRRYGKPKIIANGIRLYVKGDMELGASVRHGVVWQLGYMHSNGIALSNGEKQTILSLYGRWRQLSWEEGNRSWVTLDGRLTAFEPKFWGGLNIFIAAEADKERAEGTKRLQDGL